MSAIIDAQTFSDVGGNADRMCGLPAGAASHQVRRSRLERWIRIYTRLALFWALAKALLVIVAWLYLQNGANEGFPRLLMSHGLPAALLTVALLAALALTLPITLKAVLLCAQRTK